MCLKNMSIFQLVRLYSSENVEIECDAISNTDFGHRIGFICHLNQRILNNITLFHANQIQLPMKMFTDLSVII